MTPSAPDAQPTVFPTDGEAGTTLLLAPVTAAEANRPYLTPEEQRRMETFSSEARRNEWSSWRRAVRHFHDPRATIGYDANGAPVLAGDPTCISVSHAASWVALLLAPRRCAVDIERTGRNFARVAERYLAPQEAALPEHGHPHFLPLMWCAKETLYKLAGEPGLSLTDDLRIDATDLARGFLSGTIRRPDGRLDTVSLHTFTHDGLVGTWAVEPLIDTRL